MTNFSLGERLTHLRGMIADRADLTVLLFEADSLISFEKQQQHRRKEMDLDAREQEVRKLARRLKEAGKEKKGLEELVGNLRQEMLMMGVKCRSLEEQVSKLREAPVRQERTQGRQERRSSAECGVQVETLSNEAMEALVRNYRSELRESELLRRELAELREAESEWTAQSTFDCEEDEVDEGASFSETPTPLTFSPNPEETTPGPNSSVFDRFLTMSKQIVAYFKDQ